MISIKMKITLIGDVLSKDCLFGQGAKYGLS